MNSVDSSGPENPDPEMVVVPSAIAYITNGLISVMIGMKTKMITGNGKEDK